jgi:cation-transporting ATPase E
VGENSYAFKLSNEARRFSMVKSELRSGIDRVIKLVSWLMIPTAVLLVSSQLAAHDGVVGAIQASTAGLVAMVPEGLVLLTSIAFAVGATRLASKKVLTQELAAIEGLARVDVICVDKTGTLTEGSLTLGTLEHLEPTVSNTASAIDAAAVLGAMGAADAHPNPSLAAIAAEFRAPANWNLTDSVPFSSARKWSAASFAERGSFVLGAPDILLDHAISNAAAASDPVAAARLRVEHYATVGRRVLILMLSPDGLQLITIGVDKAWLLSIWRLDDDSLGWCIPQVHVWIACFTPHSEGVLVRGENGVEEWDTASRECRWKVGDKVIKAIAMSSPYERPCRR